MLKAHGRGYKRHWAVPLQRAEDKVSTAALSPKSRALKMSGTVVGGIFALLLLAFFFFSPNIFISCIAQMSQFLLTLLSSVVSISSVGCSSILAAPMRRWCIRRVFGLRFAQFLIAVVSTLSTNRLFVPRSLCLVSEGLNRPNWKLCAKLF